MSSIAPDDLRTPVRAVLSTAGEDDLDAVDILDVLWLAATMDAAARADPDAADEGLLSSDRPRYRRRRVGSSVGREARPESEEADRSGRADGPDTAEVFDDYDYVPGAGAGRIAARRIRLGGPGPLPGKLELARALRPFRQSSASRHRMVLDVEATIRATAAARQMLPIMRPGKERRFSVDLVFDVSPSMLVWGDAFAELISVFEYVGAFRDVKQWRLHAGGGAGDVWLTDGSGRRWQPSTLRSTDRRRITLIVTDAVAGHWYASPLWRHLTDWGMSGTVALLDLLPLKLWNFSGVGPNRIRVRATSSAATNTELTFNLPRRWRLAGRQAKTAVPFPVVELSPVALAGWSAMVATAHPVGSAALLIEAEPPNGTTEAPPQGPDGQVSLKNFIHTASPAALRLAVMAATREFTTLDVLRSIQRELLPGSAVSDLAEVLVSGIYQHEPDKNGHSLRIRMDPGCRAELRKLASPQDRWDVYRAVSTVIQRESADAGASFQAAVYDESGDASLPEKQRPFAEMARTALAQARTALAQARAVEPRAEPSGVTGREEPVRPPSSRTGAPAADQAADWDFFISYVQADRGWAEWIAWALEEDGHRVLVQAWDFVPGTNWVQSMSTGVSRSARTIAVLSPDYLESTYAGAEWHAAWASDPTGEQRKLLLVRVRETARPGLLGGVASVDLFGISEQVARDKLRSLATSVAVGRAKPASPPSFPGGGGAIIREPRFPGSLPSVWRIPAQNPNFLGRGSELAALAADLARQTTVTVQSVHGLGGVGKTQLALQFAHSHAADYDLVYWINAEEPASIPDQFAGLATALGLEPVADPEVLRLQVFDRLRDIPGWLLIFDNASSTDEVRPWLPDRPMPPGIPGHVIVTTRRGGFSALGPVLDLDVLPPAEAVELLRTRVPSLDPEIGMQIAAELGQLPLALEQAAAYMDRTRMLGQDYLRLLRSRGADLYARGRVGGREDTVATLWSLSVERISQENPAAIQLLGICAYLGTEPIPLDLFTAHPGLLPEPLSTAVADALAFTDAVAMLVDYSLAKRIDNGLQVHTLVQATTRASSSAEKLEHSSPAAGTSNSAPDQTTAHPLAVALGLLTADLSTQIADNPQAWPRWAALLPHVLAVTSYFDATRLSLAPEWQAEAARLLDGAGTYLRVQGRPAEAGPLLERALSVTEAAYGPDSPDLAGRLASLALVLRDLGQSHEALPLAERALRIDEAAHGPDHPQVATDLSNLAQVQYDLGHSQEALPLAERALHIGEATYGPDHPEVATSLSNLALLLQQLGRPEEARPLAEQALRIHEATYGPDHTQVATDLSSLGLILLAMGEPQAARPLAERALAIDESAYGPDHPDVATDLSNLALILRHLGQLQEARALIERALAVDEAAYGPDHPEISTNLSNLAQVLSDLGQQQEARPLAERALAISENALGPDHPYTLRARETLARLTGLASE